MHEYMINKGQPSVDYTDTIVKVITYYREYSQLTRVLVDASVLQIKTRNSTYLSLIPANQFCVNNANICYCLLSSPTAVQNVRQGWSS